MEVNMRRAVLGIIMAMALRTANVLSQTVIAQWNFNTESIEPSLGQGTATLLGNVTSTFAAGSPSDSGSSSNRALSIAGFPPQGKSARTAGVQFAVDTTGYENIVVWWDQRFSSAASRRAVFQLSADGETFYDAFVFDAPGEGWTNGVTFDLGNYPDLSNNPFFVFRIVSDFYENNAYAPAKPDSAYSSAGTWRFDRVTITGSIIGAVVEPPVILRQPADLVVPAGADVVFSVTASGSDPLQYQWWFGDSIIGGGTNRTLQIPCVSKTNEGIYRVVVSNRIGSVTSAPAALKVINPPTIQFTNVLVNLHRPGDASTNTFSEFALQPGEILTAQVCVTDSEGSPVSAMVECDPPTQDISWFMNPPVNATLAGALRFSPPENNSGRLFSIRLSAHNELATNTVVWKVYVPTREERNVVLTEYLANPASSAESPLFNPLRRALPAPNPTQQDEFIELVNLSNTEIDLQGWTISDSAQVRHRFADSFIVAPHGAIVIYGGPPSEYLPALDVPCIPANLNSGLSLNNSGDAILIRNAESNLVCRIVYGSKMVAPDASMTRWPDANGPFVAHATVAQTRFSPGLRPDGMKWDQQAQTNQIQGFRVLFQPDGNLRLRWESVGTVTYTIWAAERVDGPYSPIVTGLEASEYQIPFPERSQCRFYRVSSP